MGVGGDGGGFAMWGQSLEDLRCGDNPWWICDVGTILGGNDDRGVCGLGAGLRGNDVMGAGGDVGEFAVWGHSVAASQTELETGTA